MDSNNTLDFAGAVLSLSDLQLILEHINSYGGVTVKNVPEGTTDILLLGCALSHAADQQIKAMTAAQEQLCG